MDESRAAALADPCWGALHTRHRHFALIAGEARCYPQDVAPFAAVDSPSESALQQLHSLLAPGESVWLLGTAYPQQSALKLLGTLDCLQMALPATAVIQTPRHAVERLTEADVPAMVELIGLTFPGYFQRRTHQMGAYFGIRLGSRLITMGGERLALDGYTEISGVCTHPEHRGKGLGTSVILTLAAHHSACSVGSFLHVDITNTVAIDLYRHLGFEIIRKMTLSRLGRAALPG